MLRTPRKEYEKLKERQELLEYGVRLLSEREYSEAGLLDKLKSYALRYADADSVLEELKGLGYVSDERFIEMRIRYRMEDSGFGPIRIRQDCVMKGAKGDDVDLVLEAIDREEWEERAKALYRQKYHNNPRDFKEAQKRMAWIVRKGFGFDVAKIAVEQNLEGDEF